MPDMTGLLTTALANRYRIESHLGEGGMATVYLAHDVKHDRPVALKVLRPELAAVIGAERFLNEIKVTANLQHPHILPLHDSGDADGFLFYVMPYVEGETLRDKLDREKQFAIDEAIEITKSVAAALDYAHRHDVIHRDIKPENILIHEGQALVADFGIALAVSQAGGTRLTETGLSIGTPHYMSPEQAMGDRELDARSDVYSLGAMLYEMLAGDPPYTGSTAQAIVAKVITEKAPPVTTHRDTVPPHVAASVTKALSKLPADRFTSAAAFSEALTNPAFALPSTAATALAGAEARTPWNRLSVAMTGLAAVTLVVGLWGWVRPRADPPKPIARYSIALPEDQGLRPRFGPRTTLSPDASRLVYVGPGEGGVQLWLRERDQLRATPLPGTEGAFAPFFAPDGQRVGFFTPGPFTLRVVSLGGGPPVALTDSGLSPRGGSWGPDGFLDMNGSGPSGLVRVPASGGMPQPVTVLDTVQGERDHIWPDVLPNGKGALFTVWRGVGRLAENDIAVVDLATGEHRVLMRGVFALYAASGHLVYVTADGALLAVPFDEDRLELTGSATALIEGVGVKTVGAVDLALSATGKLLYVTGGATTDPDELVWVARDGTTEPIDPGWTGNFTTLVISPDGTRMAVSITAASGLDLWIKQLDR
ncbi:MAG: protein kinase, partial [Gemmatimonadales bacterium]